MWRFLIITGVFKTYAYKPWPISLEKLEKQELPNTWRHATLLPHLIAKEYSLEHHTYPSSSYSIAWFVVRVETFLRTLSLLFSPNRLWNYQKTFKRTATYLHKCFKTLRFLVIFWQMIWEVPKQPWAHIIRSSHSYLLKPILLIRSNLNR